MNEEKFWSKVDKSGECWLWSCTMPNGYGVFSSGNKTFAAHRYAYEISKGAIPAGMDVCHSCDVRNCVNPAHLWVGTRRDNMRDASAKGRCNHHPIAHQPPCLQGENHPQARLTLANVEAIRGQFTGKWGNMQEIANKYGVSRTAISDVIHGKTWNNEQRRGKQAS